MSSGLALAAESSTLVFTDARERVLEPTAAHASVAVVDVLERVAERQSGGLYLWATGTALPLPAAVEVISTRSNGAELDRLGSVPFLQAPCPSGLGPVCARTPLLHTVADAQDAQFGAFRGHALEVELGGEVRGLAAGAPLAALRVGGPRDTNFGPLPRFRGVLHVTVFRSRHRGDPAVGGDEAGALEVIRRELTAANKLWAQCGVTFGDPSEITVAVVDPPAAQGVEVGCGLGLPSSGGVVTLEVNGQRFSAETTEGDSPEVVARLLAKSLERAGHPVARLTNPRLAAAMHPSVDLWMATASPLAQISLPGIRAGEYPPVGLCLSSVNLAAGLEHFEDADANAGTLQERAILRAASDGNPRTIEVLVVPRFAGSARVGESFVDARGLGVRNAVILDRAGIEARPVSHVLAHELGHILMQWGGHPDDFDRDRGSWLMDADAAAPGIFGPRRLPVEHCERALRQSGPGAALPLLEAWPLPPPSVAALR